MSIWWDLVGRLVGTFSPKIDVLSVRHKFLEGMESFFGNNKTQKLLYLCRWRFGGHLVGRLSHVLSICRSKDRSVELFRTESCLLRKGREHIDGSLWIGIWWAFGGDLVGRLVGHFPRE